MEEVEIWKDVPNYEGYYQISTLGRLKSLSRVVKKGNGVRRTVERIIPTHTGKHGYKIKLLCKEGVNRLYSIHRIVAITFIPNPENKEQVNHLNSLRDDNRVSNLEWVTRSENMIHGVKFGNVKSSVIIDTVTGKEYNGANEAAKDSQYSAHHIWSMLNRHRDNKSTFIYKLVKEKTE